MYGLDSWITSSRYSVAYLVFRCNECGKEKEVAEHTEYGMSSLADDVDCCGIRMEEIGEAPELESPWAI